MLPEVHKPQRVFTLAEATRTLPLVKRILRDIVAAHEELEDLHAARRRRSASRREEVEKESVPARDRTDPSAASDLSAAPQAVIEARIEEKVREIDGCLRELDTIGCECKDFRMGLVDFPALLDGRVVCLCWKLGEPEIGHWHEVEDGFSGRRPVRGVFS